MLNRPARILAAGALVLVSSCTPSAQVSPSPASYSPSAACRPSDVDLKTVVGEFRPGLGLALDVVIAIPNHMACAGPDVTTELEDDLGKPLSGVEGSPLMMAGGGACDTNVSVKCSEDIPLYWSNWCGRNGPFKIAVVAFAGHLRQSSEIPNPPPCLDSQAMSTLAGIQA